jgi:hypothetical protein
MVNKNTRKKHSKSSEKTREQATAASTILYHVTTPDAADAILKTGFRDTTGKYLTARRWSGVWLSDVPLGVNEGAPPTHVVLEVTLNKIESELADYEWIEDGKTYREWLIPARIVNQGKVRRLPMQAQNDVPKPWERSSRPPTMLPEEQTCKSLRPWGRGLRFRRSADGSTSALLSNSTATEVTFTYFPAAVDLHAARTFVIAASKRGSTPAVEDLRSHLSGTGLVKAADKRDWENWIDVFSKPNPPRPKAMALMFLKVKTGLEPKTLKTYISRSKSQRSSTD